LRREHRKLSLAIVVALDRSGSMNGAKIKQAKGAVNHILNSLNKDDRFNIVAYSDSVEAFFADEMAAANEENTRKAADILDRLEASGGTNIDEALQLSLKILGGKSSGRPKYIIFVTDGLPTVGKTNEAEIVKGATKANTCNARIFAFGVGYDVNVRLLDKLVDENNGRSDYCKPKEPIEGKISALYNKIKNPVMTELKVVLQKVTLRDQYPRKLGDLFEGDQIVMVGRYDTGAVKKLATAEGAYQGQLVVTGNYMGKERGFEYPVTVCKVGRDIRYVFIEKLWAIRRGKVRCGACRYEWIPGRLPLRLTQREWKETLHWFLRGLPAQAIAQETGLERKRVIRALIYVREAMKKDIPDVFSGTVEVDETYLGGQRKNKRL
ncbi:hypothetical protein LCGC14_2933720, partial [marine sediment metagenome]